MSPKQISIAIAEICGWKLCFLMDLKGRPYSRWRTPTGEMSDCLFPDYHGDLNAMHEAEKILTECQRSQYNHALFRAAFGDYGVRDHSHKQDHAIITATAPQRAEAFLRVLGKWKGGSAS